MSDPAEERRVPFVPLPIAGRPSPPAPGTGRDGAPVEVVYVRYRDPDPLEFPGERGRLPGPIFHAAGVLLREDEEFLALGEIAFAADNPEYMARFGGDLFPSYRHVLTIPKASILERRTLPPRPPGAEPPPGTVGSPPAPSRGSTERELDK